MLNMFEFIFLLQMFLWIHVAQETDLSANYLGCFEDHNDIFNTRVLETELYESSDNSRGKCIKECYNKGYTFSGTEDGDECWCGNEMTSYQKMSESKCSDECSGNESEYCGGSWHISIYDITQPSSTKHDQTKEIVSSPTSTTDQSTPHSAFASSSLSSSGSVIIVTDDIKVDIDANKSGDTKRSWTNIYVTVPAAIIAAVVVVSVLVLLKRRKSTHSSLFPNIFRRKQSVLVPEVVYNVAGSTEHELLYENAAVAENKRVEKKKDSSAENITHETYGLVETANVTAESEYNALCLNTTTVPVHDDTYNHISVQDRGLLDKTYSHLSDHQRGNAENVVPDTYSHITRIPTQKETSD